MQIRMVIAVLLGVASVSAAGPVTFVFDPNALLDRTETIAGLRAEQENPRIVVGNRANLTGIARTFYTATAGDAQQPTEVNAYNNWRDGLGSAGEGISAFNLWITTPGTPNNPYDGGSSASWRQELYRDGSNGNGSAGISASAGDGWTSHVMQVTAATWGVLWYTTDPLKSLRPTELGGTDVGNFSFTMTDTNAVAGRDYRVWLGASAGGASPYDTGLAFDAIGWGSRDTSIAPFAYSEGPAEGGEGSVWQGVIHVTAVPEPAYASLLAIGLAGLLGRRA